MEIRLRSISLSRSNIQWKLKNLGEVNYDIIMHSLRFLFCIGVLICVVHQISANSVVKNEAEIKRLLAQMTSNDRRTILGALLKLRGRINYRVGEFADRFIGDGKAYIRNGVHNIFQGISNAGNSVLNAGNSVIHAANDATNGIINGFDIRFGGRPTNGGSPTNSGSATTDVSSTNSGSITGGGSATNTGSITKGGSATSGESITKGGTATSGDSTIKGGLTLDGSLTTKGGSATTSVDDKKTNDNKYSDIRFCKDDKCTVWE